MVVTKENVAAHAIAEHLVALQLPQDVQQLMGRLVGYYEQRRKGSGTPLDLPVENRNHHIRQKSLLIGCGGGFLMERGQPYSPVSDWIKQVDLVLEDEGQQYGNMEEAATIARTPRTCFEIWSGGDHRQTPGGLQQTEEAKKFRRKLLKRPLALRCPTQYIQPHGLADVVARYLEGHPDSPQVTLGRFLQTEAKPRPALVDQIWAELVGQGDVKVSTQVQKAAVVILWLAMPGNDVANVRSTTFAEAAGLDGKQKWGLVLSSSAQVTRMTYQTVIGVLHLW